MANPDFLQNGTEQASTGSITVNMPPAPWAAGQVMVLYIATDGFTPSLSTPNGFVLAQDPVGNVASVNTALGETGMHVFWKTALGTSTALDPAPIIAAPSGGGTVQCCHLNTYSNCRAGNPFHIIATATVTSATTTVSPPSITTTLNGCTVFSLASSTFDDFTFNSWNSTGAASPAGTIDSGWDTALGNDCSWAGGRGGFATAGGPHNCTSTFGTATVQAQISFALASLAETVIALDDGAWVLPRLVPPAPAPLWRGATYHQDELQGSAAATIADEDYWFQPLVLALAAIPRSLFADSDEAPQAATVATIEDYWITWPAQPLIVPPRAAFSDQDDLGALRGQTDEDYWTAPPPIRVPWTPRWLTSDAEETIAGVPSGPAQVVGAGYSQRTDATGPPSGTLSTAAPSAWAATTAYVLDQTAGGINRVTNGGNLYQCRTSGTSAGSGGPTGTGTDITDGTAHWTYQGPAPISDTTAGELVLAITARGNESTASSIPPTDNDGGTYTVIFDTAYASFPASFAGLWRRNTSANNKVNFVESLIWGETTLGSGVGSETTGLWVSLRNVAIGAPHASSQVERATGTGGIVTAAAITTTVRCLIISVWAGNGVVITPGTSHVAAPQGGLQLIPGANALMSLSNNGYIQFAVAWRIAPPGTSFAESWDVGGGNEGAQLFTAAFADLSILTSTDGDEAAYWLTSSPQPQQVVTALAARIAVSLGAIQDEVTTATVGLDDGSPWTAPGFGALAWQAVRAIIGDDDLATLAGQPDEDFWALGPSPTQPQLPPRIALTDQDDAGSLHGQPDEDYWIQPQVAVAAAPLRQPFTDQDEVSQTAAIIADEDYWITWPPQVAQPPRITFAEQDDAGNLSGLPEEVYWTQAVQAPTQWRATLWLDVDDVAVSITLGLPTEDYWWTWTQIAQQIPPRVALVDQDDLGNLSGLPDESYWIPAQAAALPVPPRGAFGDQDDFVFGAIAGDDDFWLLGPVPLVTPTIARGAFGDQDELGAGTFVADDDDYSPRIPPMAPAWLAMLATYADELPVFVPPPPFADPQDEWTASPMARVALLPLTPWDDQPWIRFTGSDLPTSLIVDVLDDDITAS